jgi:alpha-L-fucosidase 2
MIYWIAELTNLGECLDPLFRWIRERLVPSGRHTAKALYGCSGWVAHIVSNPWGFSAPGWSNYWGIFPTGGIWVASHLWDHYRFHGDRDFLETQAYPVLKEAAEFFLDYLVEHPQKGWLVTGPACSPENAFLYDGERIALTMGPTVDRILIYELFSACIQASQILEVDTDFRATLEQARSKLPPYQIGKHGQLQEWLEDYDEAIQRHRHTSHLLGLFPFDQISPFDTPELARAARVSVERRLNAPGGFEDGAWARNNMTLFLARLEDGEAAHESLDSLFWNQSDGTMFVGTKLAPRNAYEMDYNTGATASIAEMLLQSQRDRITLLPALPSAWPTGHVKGLCAQGGFEVDIAWKQGKLTGATIRSKQGTICRVRTLAPINVKADENRVRVKRIESCFVEFETTAGASYELVPPQ